MALPTLMGYNQCSWKLWHRGSDRACSSLQKEECWGERAMRVAMEVQVVKVATLAAAVETKYTAMMNMATFEAAPVVQVEEPSCYKDP